MGGQYAWIPQVAGLYIASLCYHRKPQDSSLNRALFWLGPPLLCGLVGLLAHWGPLRSAGLAAWAVMVGGLLYVGHGYSIKKPQATQADSDVDR